MDLNEDFVMKLPKELKQFVRPPDNVKEDDFLKKIQVKRSSAYEKLHKVLSGIMFPYSLAKMVLVRDGEIGLTWWGDQPEVLAPGRHCLLHPTNRFLKKVKTTEPVITHGTIFIIRVKRGEFGYGIDMETGDPILLEPGKHAFRSDTFVFQKFVTFNEKRTQLDQMEVVRVETGYVGYGFEGGDLAVYPPGLHLFKPPSRFTDVLTTQSAILDLPKCVQETSDYVPLCIKAGVFYQITDPLKALTSVENITKQIKDTAVATLAGIIRASSLADVASSSRAQYSPPQKASHGNKQEPSAPAFYQHVHDEFLLKLQDDIVDWGVRIQNMRIQDLQINDDKLARSISQQAITVSEQHNEYLMLQKKTDIVTVDAQNEATTMQINAEAEARAIETKARAEAQAMIIRAEAEKRARELLGEGDGEYARILSQTKLGEKLSLLKVEADALAGLNKVAYVPHLPSLIQTGNLNVDSSTLMPHMHEK